MKILACSDIHGDVATFSHIMEKEKAKVDAIIIAGDLTSWPKGKMEIPARVVQEVIRGRRVGVGAKSHNSKGGWVQFNGEKLSGTLPYLSQETGKRTLRSLLLEIYYNFVLPRYQLNQLIELSHQTHPLQTFFVLGTDDHPFLENIENNKKELGMEHFCYLHRKLVDYAGAVLFGYSGSEKKSLLGLYDWEDKECRATLARYISSLKRAKNFIFVSHCPPYRCLDFSIAHGQRHIGSMALREVIEETRPCYFICGHSHYSGGSIGKIGSTKVINVAPLRPHPRYGGRYAIIDPDQDLIKFEIIDFG